MNLDKYTYYEHGKQKLTEQGKKFRRSVYFKKYFLDPFHRKKAQEARLRWKRKQRRGRHHRKNVCNFCGIRLVDYYAKTKDTLPQNSRCGMCIERHGPTPVKKLTLTTPT